MRLTELNPKFVGYGGEGITDAQGNPVPWRDGVGLSFDCPCPQCSARRGKEGEAVDFYLRVFVPFSNPLDGGPPIDPKGWHRVGETFDSLQLSPSILDMMRCKWHGFVGEKIPGEVTTC